MAAMLFLIRTEGSIGIVGSVELVELAQLNAMRSNKKSQWARVTIFMSIAAALAACGGGGGSSAPPPPPMPSITVSPSSITVTASVTAAAAPTAVVDVTFVDAPTTVYFMASDFSTNGISSVSAPAYNATNGSFTVTFKAPSALKPAVYSDTDTLLLCSDPQCATVVSKYTLMVTYTVTAVSGGSAPQVTLDSNSLNIQALSVDQGDVPATPDPVQFTFANFTMPSYVQLNAPTTGGISSLNFVMNDATHGGIAFVMQPPSELGAGTYITMINATVCLDATCANPVAGGNFTITLTYAIGNTVTVAGTNGYTMTAVPATATAIAGNAAQPIIYESIASTANSDASTIEALNPMTGTSTFSPQAIGGYKVLAISDDGVYLYTPSPTGVNQVLTSNLTVNLSISGAGGVSIAVAPGQPQTIAAASAQELQIFDGTVARPDAATFCAIGCGIAALQWGTTSVVYGQYNAGAGAPLPECSYAVGAAGLTGAHSCSSTSTYPFSFANGLGYVAGGTIVNAATWATVATMSAPNLTVGTIFPDTSTGKSFAFATNSNTNECTIESFNLTTNTPIANLHLPSAGNGSNCIYPIVRWGANGLAVNQGYAGSTGYVLVISGAFVAP
jgi:hypothetical protein